MANGPASRLQRWGFLFTEAVLIVASILLAFALDSWWDERRDRVEEREILQGLQEEFRLNRAKLEYRVERHATEQGTMEVLLAATRSGRWTETDLSLDAAIASMLTPPTTDLGNGVLDALISAGRMELLSDRALRAKLAAWRGVMNEVSDDEIMNRDFVFDRVVPYLIAEGVPVSGPMATWWPERGIEARHVADDPAAVERLLGDPRFQVIIEARLGFRHHTSGEYREALEAVDEILTDIERSLSD